MNSIIKKWKNCFDSTLEQKYNEKPNWKETGKLVAVLLVITAVKFFYDDRKAYYHD